MTGSDRISPLPEGEWSDDVAELLAVAKGSSPTVPDFFAILARHPGLLRRWLPFGGKLVAGGAMPARAREVLVLRTAWRCGANSEWGLHVLLAHDAGLDSEQVDAVSRGPDDPRLDDVDAALVTAVDELHDTATVGESTWAVLATHFDDKQLIELPMLVGQYHLIAYVQNALQIRPDPRSGGLEAR